MANAMAQMTATMQQMTDAQIREAVEMISAAPLNADSRFVRAHLIEEYIRRNGEQAGDELMTAVGL
jgi:DNA-binding MurR/RpiR family transcriptional regulator